MLFLLLSMPPFLKKCCIYSSLFNWKQLYSNFTCIAYLSHSMTYNTFKSHLYLLTTFDASMCLTNTANLLLRLSSMCNNSIERHWITKKNGLHVICQNLSQPEQNFTFMLKFIANLCYCSIHRFTIKHYSLTLIFILILAFIEYFHLFPFNSYIELKNLQLLSCVVENYNENLTFKNPSHYCKRLSFNQFFFLSINNVKRMNRTEILEC